jgi:hypothetical protein
MIKIVVGSDGRKYVTHESLPHRQKSEWAGLTEDERSDLALLCGSYETVLAVETILREKNGYGS